MMIHGPERGRGPEFIDAEPSAYATRMRAAGVDPDKLRTTLGALDPADRPTLCLLIRNDFETLSCDLHLGLRRWDRRWMRRVVHQIVSLSATVGATDLHQAALRLQARLHEGRSDGLDPMVREVERRATKVRLALAEVPTAV